MIVYKKINNSYKINSKLDINTEDGEYLINSNTNSKNLNDIFTQVEFTKDSENIVDFNLVKKNNVVGLKMDDLIMNIFILINIFNILLIILGLLLIKFLMFWLNVMIMKILWKN